jgi:drug/metabolite transporter (DMT)-like permease
LNGLGLRAKYVLCFATIYLVWGASYLVTRIGVLAIPPLLFSTVRFIIGGLLLFAIGQAIARRRVRAGAGADADAAVALITRGDWKDFAIAGFFTVLVSNGFNVWALQWLPSNQAALLNTTSAFWIAIFGTFGRRAHPLSLPVGTGLAVGCAGTVLLLWPAGAHAGAATGGAVATVIDASGAPLRQLPFGLLLPQLGILLGCMAWAAGTIHLRNARTRQDVLSFTGLQMFCGGLMMGVATLLAGELGGWRWSVAGVGALLFLIVFSSCMAYAAYGWLSVHATPAQVGTYGFVNPAIATLLGWAVLGERLTALQVVGVGVILLGLVLVNMPAAPPGVGADAALSSAPDSGSPAAGPSATRGSRSPTAP